MNAPVTVSPKYQVTIPAEVRERHGFKPGDKLVWYDSGLGPLKLIKPLTFRELRGFLSHLPYEPFVREKTDPDEVRDLG